jgi:beta-galactosidase
LETPEGMLRNEWRFWSFPYPHGTVASSDVCCAIASLRPALAGARFDRQPMPGTHLMITDRLSRQIVQYLWDGGRVWLMVRPGQPHDTIETRYLPPFWSYLWFSGKTGTTMGMLIRPHPSLGRFPHDGFSDWHWYYLVDGAVAVPLDTVRSVTPIVEVVDSFNRAKRLAYAFETLVGRGCLFVSTWKLFDPTVLQRPEGRFLCSEVLRYLQSDSFRPDTALTLGEVLGLVGLER